MNNEAQITQSSLLNIAFLINMLISRCKGFTCTANFVALLFDVRNLYVVGARVANLNYFVSQRFVEIIQSMKPGL